MHFQRVTELKASHAISKKLIGDDIPQNFLLQDDDIKSSSKSSVKSNATKYSFKGMKFQKFINEDTPRRIDTESSQSNQI